MTNTNRIAEIAALIGEPARAAMLTALMDNRALTAGELATAAGIAAQTASTHLARMTTAGLLTVERQGRHRYHRLASQDVARMVEGIMHLAGNIVRPITVGPRDKALRDARTCYDHLAGRLGVGLADALVARGHVELDHDAGLVTDSGQTLLSGLGIAFNRPTSSRRLLCRPCLDWSERRPHIAGMLGAALCQYCLDRDWIRRSPTTRAVTVTPMGRRGLFETFGLRDAG